MDTIGNFLAFFTREINFLTFSLLSCTPTPFRKRVYSKRKEFAPIGSNFFPFRVDPFSEGSKTILTRVVILEMLSISLKTAYKHLHLCYRSNTNFVIKTNNVRFVQIKFGDPEILHIQMNIFLPWKHLIWNGNRRKLLKTFLTSFHGYKAKEMQQCTCLHVFLSKKKKKWKESKK